MHWALEMPAMGVNKSVAGVLKANLLVSMCLGGISLGLDDIHMCFQEKNQEESMNLEC